MDKYYGFLAVLLLTSSLSLFTLHANEGILSVTEILTGLVLQRLI
jgi:hypothetical protein